MQHPDQTASDADHDHPKFLGLYYPSWMIAAVSFVFATAYFPGYLNSDFDMEWIGGGHPVWSDWHTIGFSLFVRLVTLVIRKPFMVTVAQYIIYVLTANYGVHFINKHFSRIRKLDWIFSFMYLGFGAYCCMHVGSMIKDNNSAPLLFAFTVAVLDYIMSKNHGTGDVIRMIALGFLAAVFRHSMITIILVDFAVLAVYYYISSPKEDKKSESGKVVAAGLIILAVYMLLTEGLAFGLMKFERNPKYISYTIPMNLAASMAFRESIGLLTIDDPDIVAKMEQIIPMDKWAEYYCAYDADTTCRTWHDIGKNVEKLNDPKIASDIISVDAWYLRHYPKDCILSFFNINSMVWEVTCAKELVMYSPNPAFDTLEVHHMRKGAFFRFVEETKMYLGSTATGRAIVYRGGIYLFSMAVFAVTLWIKRCKRYIIAMLPVLMYAAALMLSIPQEMTHYVMAFPLCAVVMGMVTVFIEPVN